ncbi:MAG: hypothetical protein ACE5QW_00200 [Thermoplasmata archaeon]
MPIKYFELLAVEGKRFYKMGEKPTNVRIDHNSSVTLITEKNKKEAAIDFRFTANYQGLGVISIEGSLIYEGDAKEIATQWRTQRKMPDKVATQVHQAIMSNCIPEAVVIARDIKLPPPVPLPPIRFGGKPRESTGVEVA